MGRAGMSKYIDKRLPSTFKIQITSMVDMFVILLVFLIKSYNTSPINVTPSENLTLPSSSAETDPLDVLKMVVSKSGIFVENKKVMDFENGEIPKKEIDGTDPMFISSLFTELDEYAKKTKKIAVENDTIEFDGKILMQADRDTPYALLQKVMYTSMLAGYSDLKLAVASKD